jgi:tRNA (guanine-N7-)-methyltransferase
MPRTETGVQPGEPPEPKDLRPWGVVAADLPDPSTGRIGPDFFFPGRDTSRPFELEIGSGKGTFLVQEAATRAGSDFLGVEYAGEFFRHAADRVRRRGMAHVRLLYADAVEFVRHWVADGCVSVVHLYFSDPWPKKRHHKRRVVQLDTLAEFHRVLRPAGELRLVTDHPDLWAWYEERVPQVAHLFERRPFERPASAGEGEVVGTNFERKYRREGRPFHAMTLVRRG